MTLLQAFEAYPIAAIDRSMLRDQEAAFQNCLTFLGGLEKTKGQNRNRSTYGLKHIIENPSGRFDIPWCTDCYTGYIYEGTLQLAALAAGFTLKRRGQGLKATLNYSERSLLEVVCGKCPTTASAH